MDEQIAQEHARDAAADVEPAERPSSRRRPQPSPRASSSSPASPAPARATSTSASRTWATSASTTCRSSSSSRCSSQVTAPRVGIILDVRNPDFAARFPEILARLRQRVPGHAAPLPRRFGGVAHPPLLRDAPAAPARRASRSLLAGAAPRARRCSRRCASVADVVVDTSAMTVHELRSFIQKTFVGDPDEARHGRLRDVLRLQVRRPARRGPALRRALPRQPALRPGAEGQDGLGPGRRRLHREGPGDARRSSTGSTEFLDYLLPLYEREHKSYLSIGIGCTGGKHRSVYIAERLARPPEGAGVSRSASRTATPRASEIMPRLAMIGILLVTHGRLAEELRAAALTIQPEIDAHRRRRPRVERDRGGRAGADRAGASPRPTRATAPSS